MKTKYFVFFIFVSSFETLCFPQNTIPLVKTNETFVQRVFQQNKNFFKTPSSSVDDYQLPQSKTLALGNFVGNEMRIPFLNGEYDFMLSNPCKMSLKEKRSDKEQEKLMLASLNSGRLLGSRNIHLKELPLPYEMKSLPAKNLKKAEEVVGKLKSGELLMVVPAKGLAVVHYIVPDKNDPYVSYIHHPEFGKVPVSKIGQLMVRIWVDVRGRPLAYDVRARTYIEKYKEYSYLTLLSCRRLNH